MDEVLIAVVVLVITVLLLVLPVVTFVRTLKIRTLERRVAGLEAALLRLMQDGESAPTESIAPTPTTAPAAATPPAPARGLRAPARAPPALASLASSQTFDYL